MGQYYKIVNVDKKEYFSPWDFHCGAKLMEWNYVGDDMAGNPVTNTLHHLLEHRWKGDRVYVVGDYANVFNKRESNFFCKKLKELAAKLECEVAEVPDAEVQTLFESIGVKYNFSIEPWHLSFVKLMNEIPGLERPKTRNDQYIKTLYSCCNDEDESGFTGIGATIPQEVLENYKRPRYLCNAATKEYIDTKALPIAWSYDMAEEKRKEFEKAKKDTKNLQYLPVAEAEDTVEFEPDIRNTCIDPLGMLLACGNDRGGGDYHSGYPAYDSVGTWVSTSDQIFQSNTIPEGYTKSVYDFCEEDEIKYCEPED